MGAGIGGIAGLRSGKNGRVEERPAELKAEGGLGEKKDKNETIEARKSLMTAMIGS